MSERRLFVPGRLCLLGEHADWAGGFRGRMPDITPGYCLAVGTTQGITAEVARIDGCLRVDSHKVDGFHETFSAPAEVAALNAAAQNASFYAYCAGTAAYMAEAHGVGGLCIRTMHSDLSIKKGLSSSAAICVLTVRAYNQLYGLGLTVREEMECAYAGEIKTGSQCGRMDQVCAFGQTPVFLTFDAERMDVQPLAPGAPLHLVIIDLQRGKDTRRILHDLNSAFVSNSACGAKVRDALGPQNARIVAMGRDAILQGEPRRIGELMIEAQEIFDRQVAPACPGELAAPILHAVLQHPRVRELSWGGKGVGSQGDGCAQVLARSAEAQRILLHELPGLLGVKCLELNIGSDEGTAV